MKTRHRVLLITSLVLFSVRCKSRREENLKQDLKHSTLKGAMTSSFFKVLL